MHKIFRPTLLCLLGIAALTTVAGARQAQNWPSFRGVRGSGVADGQPTPAAWDVPKGTGLRWKTPLAGLGHFQPDHLGQPAVRDDRKVGQGDHSMRLGLYGDIASVTDDTVHTWLLTCMDTSTGKVLFETKMHEGVRNEAPHRSPRTPIRRWPPTARTSSRCSARKGCLRST